MVWENVPGAFSSNHGEDFRAVLEETIHIAEPDTPDIPLPEKGKWPLADCWYGDGWSVAYRVFDAQFWGVPQRRRRIALVADFGGHTAPEILFERSGVCWDSAESGETGQGSARDFTDGVGETGGNQIPLTFGIGNGQTNQEFIPERIGALNCMHDQKAIATFQNTGHGWWNQSDIAECIRTPCGGDSTKANLVAAVDCRNGTENTYVNGTLQAKESGGTSLNLNNTVRTGYAVRRLTPLECERLQGYPDGWTDIGPWTDSNGKLHKESSDSARYKALGNSISIPNWKWVLKRLCAFYERDATMAILFDGIGGFPLIWEQLNGKGSCIWASEIEEFPIAVTKRRFAKGEL
jgi:DNA (cytosine-5)-methyltransferase 1